ncbi:MAG: tetratricopeptide repeat protein, partial [Sphingomonas sp.]|nr:tetratricopeptide repeat protein [Sphingomonas sp.]
MAEQETDASPAAQFIRQARGLVDQERWMDAVTLYRRAASEAPEDADVALYLGVLLSKLGHLPEGENELRRGIALAPNSAPLLFSLSLNLLAQGRYAEGWPLHRAKDGVPEFNRSLPRDFPFPRWNGEDLAGKRLVLFPEQGLGDEIQLVRFLPSLLARGAAVTLLTRNVLARLFRHSFPSVEIVVAQGAAEFDDPDYWAMLSDLPGLLGIKLDAIPAQSYLASPSAGPALGKGFNIGLKTRGNPNHVNDKRRSLPEELGERLRAQLAGNVISLEPEDSGAVDMADTAAIIEQLDLVVSVDTSVAHLAGALGKPCLLLVPGFSPDWRWMRERDDSTWYPEHRLFRGTVEGDWSGAIDRLVAEAQRRAAPASISAPRTAARPAPPKGSLTDILLRGQALCAGGRYSEALDLFRKAARLAPDNPAPLHLLGVALLDVGRLKEAEQYQRRALALVPDHPIFQNSLSLNLLAQGRYREAWPLHEGRGQKSAEDIGFPVDVPCARWRGEPLRGKHIVVMPEQGFGDAIQFVRFLPRLQETGARITVFAAPALVDLFATSFAEIDVRPAAGDVRLGSPDYWTTLVDMMRPLDLTLEDVTAAPYLVTDRRWPAFPDPFTVGLVTSGNPKHVNDQRRSLPPDMAARLREGLPGAIVSLD